MPYIEFLDLAVIFYVLVSEDEMGTGSITIHNSLMEAWGTDKKELLKIAMHNIQRRFTGHVYNMMSIIESMMGRDAELDREVRNCFYEMESVYEDDICPMYVATNSKKLNGACVMLYDGLLRDFARRVGKSFYIKYSYLYLPVMNIIYLKADGNIYFKSKEQHWFWNWKNRKFDNHNMALKLIEILYEKQFINEATYNQIMKNKLKLYNLIRKVQNQ